MWWYIIFIIVAMIIIAIVAAMVFVWRSFSNMKFDDFSFMESVAHDD